MLIPQCVTNPFRLDFCKAFSDRDFDDICAINNALLCQQRTCLGQEQDRMPPDLRQRQQEQFYSWLQDCVQKLWYADLVKNSSDRGE